MATKTVTTDVEVSIDLDDFDNEELVDELIERIEGNELTSYQKQAIVEVLMEDEDCDFGDPQLPNDTLLDELKIEHLQKVFSKYSLQDFEQLLPL